MGIFASSLPRYSGPHAVGLTDIEVSLCRPRSFGTTYVSSPSGPVSAFTYDTVLFTLFYPCSPARSERQGVPWLERPIGPLLNGWLKFADRRPTNTLYSAFLLFVTWCIGARVSIPARANAQPKPSPKQGESYPLVLFSHGLAGNRRVYSQFCGELASRGFVVAAVEHRDGTAPTTSIHGRDGRQARRLDYISYDEAVWSGKKEKLSAMQCRAEQLSQRVSEVSDCLSALRDLFSPSPPSAFDGSLTNLRPGAADLGALRGAIDTGRGKVVMAGHSFGSATALQVLKDSSVNEAFGMGICLDPWVDPLGLGVAPIENGDAPTGHAGAAVPDAEGKASQIRAPLLIQNSERFTLWDEHFAKVKPIVRSVQASSPSYLMTICRASHTSFSDFELLRPRWLLAIQRFRSPLSTMDPEKDMQTIVQASLEFLGVHSHTEGGLLQAEVDKKDPRDVKRDETGKRRLHGRPGEVALHYRG